MKNNCAATVLEDFVNALWRVITALDFYRFKLEVIAHLALPLGELSAQPTERALSAPYGGTSPKGRGKRGFAASTSTSSL